MLKVFKKTFYIVCEDITMAPSASNIHKEIGKFCELNGYPYAFTGANEVVIGGRAHDVRCARSPFYRGRYVIKCREK